MLDSIMRIENVTIYTPYNVNHILREIDDSNDVMKAKQQYKRLSTKPIHNETREVICKWLEKFKN